MKLYFFIFLRDSQPRIFQVGLPADILQDRECKLEGYDLFVEVEIKLPIKNWL